MTISAKIIADSVSSDGVRLTTMQLRYPRAIHAEFMTHRVFSRNASSSRAIPVKRLIQDVLDDPFIPLHWGKNQPGMQAHEQCNELLLNFIHPTPGAHPGFISRERAWLAARDYAVEAARKFDQAGYHKQIVNRLLEPWAHINVVVTATDWANFFALRDHPDAEPHIAVLAREMKAAMDASQPDHKGSGQWHLPYVEGEDEKAVWDYGLSNDMDLSVLAVKLSVARCARVSYLTQEGLRPSIEADLALYDRLVGGVPLHASPTEHQATPDNWDGHGWLWPEQHGNFNGWAQHRKSLPNENIH